MKKMRLLAMVGAVALIGTGAAVTAAPAFAGERGGDYGNRLKCFVEEQVPTWTSLEKVIDQAEVPAGWTHDGDFGKSSVDGSATWSAGPSGLTFSTAAEGHRKVAAYKPLSIPFSTVAKSGASIDLTDSVGGKPGIQVVIDIDGDTVKDGILVGESAYGDNWWLSEGTDAAKGYAPHTGGGNGSNWFGTLAEWGGTLPQMTSVIQGGFSMGSGVTGSGVIGGVTIGGASLSFVKETPVVRATYKCVEGEVGEGTAPADTDTIDYSGGEPKTIRVKSECDREPTTVLASTAGDCETKVDYFSSDVTTWVKEKVKEEGPYGSWFYLLKPVVTHTEWTVAWDADRIAEECAVTEEPPTVVTPPAPKFNDPCGPNNASWTTTPTTGVIWTKVTLENGEFRVTATPAEGYTFPEGAQTVWQAADSGVACPVTPPTNDDLASTGGGDVNPLFPIAGGLTVALGAALLALGILRRRAQTA